MSTSYESKILSTDKKTLSLVPKGKVFSACFTKNKHLYEENKLCVRLHKISIQSFWSY
jgi:hypothetical protein